jgi:hypothetical protein
MIARIMALGAVVALAAVTVACSHYYKVSDPAGSKEYYTTKVDDAMGGAIKIKDEKTGATVTLQSSEVKEISEEEFEKGVKGTQPKQ